MCEAEVRVFSSPGKIAEGKTKIVYKTGCAGKVRIELKPVLTAFNGKKREVIEGIDDYKTTTACNIFTLLRVNNISTHFIDKHDRNSFQALLCTMIPLEVVVRRSVPQRSSYLKRHPQIKVGAIFKDPIVELFYKDDATGDPLVYTGEEGKGSWLLFDPEKPPIEGKEIGARKPFLSDGEVFGIKNTARSAFKVVEAAFDDQGFVLHDFKVEFGKYYRHDGYSIVLADTITPDEMRLTRDGKVLDKDVFRAGGDLETILSNYAHVAAVTDKFFGDE